MSVPQSLSRGLSGGTELAGEGTEHEKPCGHRPVCRAGSVSGGQLQAFSHEAGPIFPARSILTLFQKLAHRSFVVAGMGFRKCGQRFDKVIRCDEQLLKMERGDAANVFGVLLLARRSTGGASCGRHCGASQRAHSYRSTLDRALQLDGSELELAHLLGTKRHLAKPGIVVRMKIPEQIHGQSS